MFVISLIITNTLGQRFGSPPVAAPTQVDSSRIKKKMKSILSKLSAPLLENLLSHPSEQKVRSVPIKASVEEKPAQPITALPKLEPIKTQQSAEKLAPLKPLSKSRPKEQFQKNYFQFRVKIYKTSKKPPDDFEEHMKMLQK